MGMRMVTSDFEASLWGETEPGFFSKLFGWKPKGLFGEIEVESYHDGTKEMEVKFKRLKIPHKLHFSKKLKFFLSLDFVCY